MNGSYETPAIRCIAFDIDPVMAGSEPAELAASSYNDWGGEIDVTW
ncbi:MAG: hypothetical protein MR809_00715 [Rikenellaceae bacterium]|nr:hypothetical protein [Rikenellaceae bacterium]